MGVFILTNYSVSPFSLFCRLCLSSKCSGNQEHVRCSGFACPMICFVRVASLQIESAEFNERVAEKVKIPFGCGRMGSDFERFTTNSLCFNCISHGKRYKARYFLCSLKRFAIPVRKYTGKDGLYKKKKLEKTFRVPRPLLLL